MLLAFARRAGALVGVGAWADVAVQFGPAAGVVDGACLGDIQEGLGDVIGVDVGRLQLVRSLDPRRGA